MAGEPLKPIYSSRRDDPSAGETVDRFVVDLAERIDLLQDAEAAGDVGQLMALIGGLTVAADAAGFDVFAAVARAIDAACSKDDPKLVRDKLLELTEIAQRIRLGHKGSA